MTTIIIYAAKTIVCSCAFILLYMWQFHKKVHYKYCRIYLIATMLLSVLIPALNVPIYPNRALQAQSDVQYVGSTTASASDVAVTNREIVDYIEPSTVVAPSANTAAAPAIVKKTYWEAIGLIIYLSFIAITLMLTIRSLLKIWRLRTESELIARQDFNIAKNSNVKTPFTFFKTIFVGNNYTDDEWRQIISHEASHARHLHSVERMAMTLLRTLFWFNPFMWIAAKRLEEVQEWQADNDAIGDGYAIEQYRLTILHQIFGCAPDLSLGMSSSFTKNRFIMMTQKLNRKCTRPAVLAAAVAAGAFFAFGCTTQAFARNSQTSDSEIVASNNSDTMTFTRERPSYDDTRPILTGGMTYDYNGFVEDTVLRFNSIMVKPSLTFHFDRFVGDDENEVVNNRYRSVSEDGKSIETIEFYRNGRKVSYAVANGVSKVTMNPQSSELDWVNEKTSIFFEGQLIPFSAFKKLTKNSNVYIQYLHLNSNMDFVYVHNEYISPRSGIEYRIFHPQSTFCKELPNVVPIVSATNLQNDLVDLTLVDAKTNEIYVLIVPNLADNLCVDGNFVDIKKFREFEGLLYDKNTNITLYKNAAAKNRFGENYDYVIEFTSEPVKTYSPKAPANIEDIPSASSTFLKDFNVSLVGSVSSIAQRFNVRLWEGTVYQIWSASSIGSITATLIDEYGNECGKRYSVQNGQNEVIQFHCEKTDDYTICIRSKNGGDVKGTCTLRYVNE